MSNTQRQPGTLPSHLLRREDVLAGLLFMTVAALGLRDHFRARSRPW